MFVLLLEHKDLKIYFQNTVYSLRKYLCPESHTHRANYSGDSQTLPFGCHFPPAPLSVLPFGSSREVAEPTAWEIEVLRSSEIKGSSMHKQHPLFLGGSFCYCSLVGREEDFVWFCLPSSPTAQS